MNNYQHVRKANPLKTLGSTVNMVSIEFTINWIAKCIENSSKTDNFNDQVSNAININPCKQLIITGFHGLYNAYNNDYYRKICKSADLWVPDSIAPVLIAKSRGFKNVIRTPGPDITKAFLELANEKGYRSFFYGDSEETLNKLSASLKRDYPNHIIAGMISPPFRELSDNEEQKYIDIINDSKPDILWVGLGCPKQDEWIYRCKDRLRVPVAAGIGAAFGFLAGTTSRAPAWSQRFNLEWLYMLITNPKRTSKRVLVEGPKFLFWLLCEEASILKCKIIDFIRR